VFEPSLSVSLPQLAIKAGAATVTYATYITCMPSEKEVALSLPQLGVRFLADSNSWNVNGKLQNCEADAQ